MEFIDKANGKSWAHPILKAFLDRCALMNPYPSDLFAEMKNDVDPDITINPQRKNTYLRILEGILNETHKDEDLQNGEGYCCYCMRRINASNIHSTIEHVIPKSVSDIDTYSKYFSVPSELEADQHVMVLKEVFFTRHKNQAPPFPHHIAYENFAASCDGRLPQSNSQHKCCNNFRGDNYIPPIMFMRNIHNEFKYKSQSGFVIWKDNPNIDKRSRKDYIDTLGLNCEKLRMIRMIWAYLSSNQMDCNLSQVDRRMVIDKLRPNIQYFDKDLFQDFLVNDDYWNLLEEYRYFNDRNKFV